jgi:hypothetical protein
VFELASLIFGGLMGVVPSVLEYFNQKSKFAHERDMFALRIEGAKVESELRQQEAEIKALGDASAAASRPGYRATGNRWVDGVLAVVEAFNATVRPTLTYFYCVLLYGGYKAAVYATMLDQGASWKDAAISLWTTPDYNIMLTIIGFWFVSRELRKMMK